MPECPDGGYCHHGHNGCEPNACFRVRTCEPLSGVYPDDRWPTKVQALHSEQRLYGLPESEDLYFDPASVYESECEPFIDPIEEREAGRSFTIEEWTVHPPQEHLPKVGHVLDFIAEWPDEWGEVSEGYSEHLGKAMDNDDVRAAVQALIDVIASKVTYRMAAEQVATHKVTWDDEGEPLLDGERMYRPSTTSGVVKDS